MEEQVVKGIVAKIPNGYFKPSGKKVITSTEEIDVNEFSKAQVVDNNLKPENIAKDVKVLGIVGTHEGGGGIDTSDATASANDLLLGKTAYVDGEKIVGKIQYYTNDKVVVGSYDGTTIATNGKYTPYDLRIELDASLIPSGSLSVTTNGTYDVTKFASVNINVGIPEGYLKPSGTFETSVEGTYNVSTYANATFSVQKEELNVTPSSDIQTLTPSANKFYNKVVVQPIPSDYVVPSGTKEITENGEHDVATYEKVNVNVENEIKISSVSNIIVNSDGLLTFTASDISELIEYNPVVSYLINVNETEITTTETSVDISEDLVEGENEISVVAKVILNIESNKESILYDKPKEPLILTINTTDTSTIPYLYVTGIGTTDIDWGDGNTEIYNTTRTGLNKLTKSTAYASSGEYEIKIIMSSGLMYGSYEGAFYSNINPHITNVVFPSNTTSIHNFAFYNCSSLTSIEIPSSVTSIGSNAFYNCSSLTSITIPNNVTSIGGSAFWDCSKLTNITIGNSVNSIANYAFKNCSSLQSITIPDSVTSIGEYAFSGCSNLTSVTLEPTTPPTISYNTFASNVTKFKIPASAIEAYSSATNWSGYADKFVSY